MIGIEGFPLNLHDYLSQNVLVLLEIINDGSRPGNCSSIDNKNRNSSLSHAVQFGPISGIARVFHLNDDIIRIHIFDYSLAVRTLRIVVQGSRRFAAMLLRVHILCRDAGKTKK